MTEQAGAPTAWIEGCLAAQAALLASIGDLQDDGARRPSGLPGWTVGHLLTHLARNADSVVWRLEGAAAGEVRDQYPGGLDQRTHDIEAGAGRPATELVLDVRRTGDAVARVMAGLPVAAWDAPSRTSKGIVESPRRRPVTLARGRGAPRRSRSWPRAPPARTRRGLAAARVAAPGGTRRSRRGLGMGDRPGRPSGAVAVVGAPLRRKR